jgi:hypothetical protein
VRGVAIFILALWVAGCASERYAERPILPDRHAPPESREHIYEQFKLIEDNRLLHARRWIRGQEDFDLLQIQPLVESYASTHELQESAKVRGTVLNYMTNFGIAGALFTISYNEAVNPDHQMSTGTQVGIYAAAGGLVLSSLILSFLWPDPIDQIADQYNVELRAELGLPPAKGLRVGLTAPPGGAAPGEPH